MRTLLRIDSGYRTTNSWSRRLADYFEGRWRECHPEGQVVVRDLVREPLPQPDEATMAAFYSGGDTPDGSVPPGIALSNRLIGELREADEILISSPLYNFSVPAGLKAWIDHIVRFGHTVAAGERRPVGLLAGRSVYLLTVRGGTPDRSPDYQIPVLQAVFRYIGIPETGLIPLEGTQIQDGRLDDRVRGAKLVIDRLLAKEGFAVC